MSLDHAQTIQPPEEKTVMIRRDAAPEPAHVAEPEADAVVEPLSLATPPHGHTDFQPSRNFEDGAQGPQGEPAPAPAAAVEAAAPIAPRSRLARQQRILAGARRAGALLARPRA